MITPHLPPYQAANALLPHLLGEALESRGHRVRFLSFGSGPDTAAIRYVRKRSALRVTRVPQLLEAVQTWLQCRDLFRNCDVVHIHSNTWVNQVAARIARRAGRPYVLTHYGTEIWHHDGRDTSFKRLNRDAAHVAFYSRALLERGRELGVPLAEASVIYPPVAEVFRPAHEAERRALREEVGATAGLLLLNVKRLHPLADHATLISAVPRVLAKHPGSVLLIAGTGEEERALRAQAEQLCVAEAVRFLGLVPNAQVARLQAAADLFVLSSVLEATPTVALEALACGTPVLSTDNPGGKELHDLFGHDVTVVPQRDPDALAGAILAFAEAPRRTAPDTAHTVEGRFRLPGVVDRYLELYRQAAA
jgi:glycosyltransferase involved in cell wall biosynthesis